MYNKKSSSVYAIVASDSDIELVTSIISNCLSNNSMNRLTNKNAKDGYLKALEILNNKDIDFVKAGIYQLRSIQGQSIARHAVNYLRGECNERVLLSSLIKDNLLK
ncbi:hypothetical protein [Dysgonomonas macrotermitis]|uniref:Uncharacterized protein n=1 Tax=Dysgonomonas macrotermitis TaxID=1346286 RepID=A0A1M5E5D2_9BACT|nr:hypothetical protein [Dysgonomonas macrotermitis]SHF74395.1 hypothetical protein SAMN05444362_109152 [Dysgonomonas macrotermitis]